MISLEEENKQLKMTRGIKQSSYSNYSVGELLKSGQIPDKFEETDQQIKEIGQYSVSSSSKKSFSSEINSPQNSVQSQKNVTESGSETFSNFQGLETIPENTEENASLQRTRLESGFGEIPKNKSSNIHMSMPVYEEKNSDILKQPNFMFNSLQKKGNYKQAPAFPKNKNQNSFMFRTGESNKNYNPFQKNRDIDIEIESENSNITSSREAGVSQNLINSHPEEVKITRRWNPFY